MKSKIKKSISDHEFTDKNESSESYKINPFTRGLFLRSLFLGGLGLNLRKVGYSSKNPFPELEKRIRQYPKTLS